jgi:hypothetical protein
LGYTVISYAETLRPLVAVFESGESTQALPIIGIAIYRDLADKDGENLLVPCTVREFDDAQAHYEYSRRDLRKRLPSAVVESQGLRDELLVLAGGEGVEVALEAATGAFRVVSN